jgi:hypothetical protein
MRSLTYVQAGETLSCAGCHENRETAPKAAAPLALTRGASPLRPGCEGSWPLRFDTLVQPVLDRHCVSCHRPGGECPEYDLTGDKSHAALLAYADNDLGNLVFEKDFSTPGQSPSLKSKLLEFLAADKVHKAIKVDEDEFERLYTWMDTYGHTQGSFSPEQEAELVEFKSGAGSCSSGGRSSGQRPGHNSQAASSSSLQVADRPSPRDGDLNHENPFFLLATWRGCGPGDARGRRRRAAAIIGPGGLRGTAQEPGI